MDRPPAAPPHAGAGPTTVDTAEATGADVELRLEIGLLAAQLGRMRGIWSFLSRHDESRLIRALDDAYGSERA